MSLPAEAEPNDPLGREVGEMLWGDDDYGYANALRQQKAEQPAYNWSALYQQRPAPETGSYFLDEWLRPYRVAPDRRTLHIYAASDFAASRLRCSQHFVAWSPPRIPINDRDTKYF